MNYKALKVLIMGLGLHGGGLEAARFMLRRGAEVSVTDIRDEKTLMPSIEQLEAYCLELGAKPVRYILGKHEIEDFKNADIVVKNPGVRPDSEFLQAAKRIETDISLFLTGLRHLNNTDSSCNINLFAVTGTKGKSSTASALHWILRNAKQETGAWLGGNITVSPLSFIDKLGKNDDVVLELSSFQLGDLKNRTAPCGQALLKPVVSIITAIMSDHLDRYASMDEYIDDKRNIYRGQCADDFTIAAYDNWGKSFLAETKARPIFYSDAMSGENIDRLVSNSHGGGWIDKNGRGLARLGSRLETAELVPEKLLTPGTHQKQNLLAAALAAYAAEVKPQSIYGALSNFKGVSHRLEFFHEAGGIKFYNDSAATIPQAAAACINALSSQGKVVLVTGGTDKNLDFSPFVNTAHKAAHIILLAGTGSSKIAKLLEETGIGYSGPFDNLKTAVRIAIEKAKISRCNSIALSPGCASFGMFLNEFDRGSKWKDACLSASL